MTWEPLAATGFAGSVDAEGPEVLQFDGGAALTGSVAADTLRREGTVTAVTEGSVNKVVETKASREAAPPPEPPKEDRAQPADAEIEQKPNGEALEEIQKQDHPFN